MIKFYKFPSKDTLIVHDVEKGIYALFFLSLRGGMNLDAWWESGNISVSELEHFTFTSIDDLEKDYA